MRPIITSFSLLLLAFSATAQKVAFTEYNLKMACMWYCTRTNLFLW